MSTIPLLPQQDHRKYILAWRVAEKIAVAEKRPVEGVWPEIINAIWARDLQTLAVFCPRPGLSTEPQPGRALLRVNRRDLGSALLGLKFPFPESPDLIPLLEWRCQDYLVSALGAFHAYFERDPSLGLAVLESEVVAWRNSTPIEPISIADPPPATASEQLTARPAPLLRPVSGGRNFEMM